MHAHRLAANSLSPYARRLQSSFYSPGALPAVETIGVPFHNVDINVFRKRAFTPEQPLLMKSGRDDEQFPSIGTSSSCSIPAYFKWYISKLDSKGSSCVTISPYLSSFGSTTSLPYELVYEPGIDSNDIIRSLNLDMWSNQQQPTIKLHRFNAPLSVLLQALDMEVRPRIYIAQAQISDLPKPLQDDLPTPHLVKYAGKGDIYDANLWIGIPPTYTPLHKDPNPNLFVQLSSSKRVRLFNPTVGATIFRHVQSAIGKSASPKFRGDEMMEGTERAVLDEAVWVKLLSKQGYEATVSPGDALFIPKGWWHSIKSIGTDINSSVNWWFR